MSKNEETDGLKRLAVVNALQEIAVLLQLKGDKFRPRAYAGAATTIAEFEDELGPLVEQKRLTEIKGIGQSTARVIEEVYEGGTSSTLEKLKQEVPPGALSLARGAGLDLAKIRRLNEALGITGLDQLKAAIEAGKLRDLGFTEKAQQTLLERISRTGFSNAEILLVDVLEVAEKIVEYMQIPKEAMRVELAGAIRRWKETVSDIRVVVMAEKSAARLLDHFVGIPMVATVEDRTSKRATVRLVDGVRVTLTIASPDEYWTVLHQETGSEAHLKKLEELAKQKGSARGRISAKMRGKPRSSPAESERDIYENLGMQYVPPEMREDTGEVEQSLAGEIPDDLITIEDIAGMIHCHTTYSDGRHSVEQMARAAEAMGMKYITITDHSPTAQYARGLKLDQLKRQWDEISRVQEKVSIKLLRGTESDILREGELDYPDSVLEKFDVIIASIHNRYKLDEDQTTRRVVNAMKNPFFKIWGHPSGRLVQRRPPIACRIDEILDAIAESGAAIEISGDPHRLDMEPTWARKAQKRGAKFVISTDAHSMAELANLKFGIGLARRAGVRRGEVLNTLSAKAFQRAVSPTVN